LKHDLELKLKEQVGLIKLYYNVHENTVWFFRMKNWMTSLASSSF
jgi:hypothetical protein